MSKYKMREVPMRRGLSPEGRAIRARHQSSIVFGDTPVQDARAIQNSLDRVSHECITSLVRQPVRGAPVTRSSNSTSGPSPLRATHPLPRMLAADLSTAAGGSLIGLSSNIRPDLKVKERDGSAHSDYFSLAEESLNDHPMDPVDQLSKERDQFKNLSAKYADRLNPRTSNSGQPEVWGSGEMNPHASNSDEMNKRALGATYSVGAREQSLAGQKSGQSEAMNASHHASYNASTNFHASPRPVDSTPPTGSGLNGYATYTVNKGDHFNNASGMSLHTNAVRGSREPESRANVAHSSDKQYSNLSKIDTRSLSLESDPSNSSILHYRGGNSGEFHGTNTYTVAHQGEQNPVSEPTSNVRRYHGVHSDPLNGVKTSALPPHVQHTHDGYSVANSASNSVPTVDSGLASHYSSTNHPIHTIPEGSSPLNSPVARVPASSNQSNHNFKEEIQGERSSRSNSSGSDRKTLLNDEIKDACNPTLRHLEFRENVGGLRSENHYETEIDALDSVRAAAAEALSVIGQNEERSKASQRQKNQELSADNPLLIGRNCESEDFSKSSLRNPSFSPKLEPLSRGSQDGFNHFKERNFTRPDVHNHRNDCSNLNREPPSPGRSRKYADQKDSISSIIRNIDDDLLYLSRKSESQPLGRFSNLHRRSGYFNPVSGRNVQSEENSPQYQPVHNSPRRWSSSPSVIDENVNKVPTQLSGHLNQNPEAPSNSYGLMSQSTNSASHDPEDNLNADQLRTHEISSSHDREDNLNSCQSQTKDTGRPESRSLGRAYGRNDGVINTDISREKQPKLLDVDHYEAGSSSSRSPNVTKQDANSSNISCVGHQKSSSLNSLDKEESTSDQIIAIGHHKCYPSLDATYSKDSLLSRLQGGTSTGLMPATIHRPSDFTKSLRNNSVNRHNSNRRKPMKASDISPTLAGSRSVDAASVVSRELRETKVSDVIAKIKEKKPTCDMNYLTVKQSLERQHKAVFSNNLKAKESVTSGISSLPSARSVTSNRGVRSRSVDSSRRFPEANKPKENQVLDSYSSQTNLCDRRLGRENLRSRAPVKHMNIDKNRQMDGKKMSPSEHNSRQRNGKLISNPLRQQQQHQVPPLALQGITHTTLDDSRSKNPRDSLASVDINSVDGSSVSGSVKLPLNLRSNSLGSAQVTAADEETSVGESQNPPPVRRKGNEESGSLSHGVGPADHPLDRIAELPSGSGSHSSSGRRSPLPPPQALASPEEDYVTSTPREDLDQQQFDPPAASVLPKTTAVPSHTSQRVGRRTTKEKPEPKVRSKSGDPPPSYKRGQVPRYLRVRRAEEARAEAEEAARDPDCPVRHTKLPEEERLSTLRLLRHSEREVLREISSLPLAQDTLRLRARRAELEDKLQQLEDGIKIFSQPKVYVLNDE